MKDAMQHLGAVLSILCDLADDERCGAIDKAVKFWNETNPESQIQPSGYGYTLLVNKSPHFDADFDPAQMPSLWA